MKKLQPAALKTVIVIVIVLLIVFLIRLESVDAPQGASQPSNSGNQTQVDDSGSPVGPDITVSGTYVCLPHNETTGPQTMECALGIETDNKTYYALRDTTGDYSILGTITTGAKIQVRGVLAEQQQSPYQTEGVITIKELNITE